MKQLFYLLVIIALGCGNTMWEDFFESVELQSSKGEKIYINTVIYGVTADYQLTIVTKDKERLRNSRRDTVGVTNIYSPFLYRFKSDTLDLYFSDTITYYAKERFNTIFVSYHLLSGPKFSKLSLEAEKNNEYFQVPKYVERVYPDDMPKPPAKN